MTRALVLVRLIRGFLVWAFFVSLNKSRYSLASTVWTRPWRAWAAPWASWCRSGTRSWRLSPPGRTRHCRTTRTRSTWTSSSVCLWTLWPKSRARRAGMSTPSPCRWTLAAGGRWTGCSPRDLETNARPYIIPSSVPPWGQEPEPSRSFEKKNPPRRLALSKETLGRPTIAKGLPVLNCAGKIKG